MPLYEYKARDKFGKLVSGRMSAESEDIIAGKLNELRFTPISVREIREDSTLNNFFSRFRQTKFFEFNNLFTRQFAVLQHAGLPVLVSLKTLKEQTTNKFFKNVIAQIIRDIEAGISLSSALGKHSQIFNALYVNMVESGEASGLLAQTLDRLAALGERDETIRMRISMAARYPIIVVVAMVIGFLILTTLVVPRFAQLYSQFTTALPLPTQIILGIHYLITKLWWLLLLLITTSLFICNKFVNTKQGRFWWDSFKLKIPIFGPLMLKLTMSRFSRVTGTLLTSGIPILKVLELASSGTGNALISRTIDNIRINVSEGKGMFEPMKASGIFPPIVIQMVSVGESTGKLDELLIHVSNYYDSQVDYTINNLVSLIEPILIFVLGSLALFMALGIFLPMWNLMSLFKQ